MKYSIIIPVFNAEKTLARCVDSLISQQYTDCEIILVDDGSSDNSSMLCRNYSEKYPNIKYIAKKNGGVSTARNAGLDAAAGEYVLFVDSDDYVATDYFDKLNTIDAAWDYVLFSYYVDRGEIISEKKAAPYSSVGEEDYFDKISELIYRKKINSPWNKRYKRSVIETNGIRFHTELSIGEDGLFNILYALCARSCCTVEFPIYYVNVENDQSLSRKPRNDLKEQLSIGTAEIFRSIRSSDLSDRNRSKFFEAMNVLELSEIYSEAKRMQLSGVPSRKRLNELYRLCNSFIGKNASLPDTKYCKLLYLPVKFRLTLLLDLVGWKLAH